LLKKERKRRDEDFGWGEKEIEVKFKVDELAVKVYFQKKQRILPNSATGGMARRCDDVATHMEIRADICPGINWDRADKYPFNRSPSTPLMTFTFNISAQQG
jgi:hypothetical protein